jgi:uncharacterized protein DUF2604
MSAPFVTTLRSRKTTLQVGAPGAESITIRVEMAEVWDVVAIAVSPNQAIVDVKTAALTALYPEGTEHRDFMLKLNGWEILDEHQSLSAAGIVDGSILLLTFRRRRAVR